MLVSKKNRLAVYSYLFKEGVIVTRKEHTMVKHPQVEVPLLHVVKLLLSLKSRNYVTERYAWRYLYYTLTDAGIEYLRNYLHVGAEVVPATLKKASKPQPPPSFGRRFEDSDGSRGGRGRGRGRGGFRGDRDSYRAGKEGTGAPRNFNPEFAGARGGRGGARGGRGGSRGGAAAGEQ
jgi:small subunit ribosomal protein S10e